MRLWHKDLIPYLPRQQLLGQWRELCAIAKAIHDKGTTNHILVNRIMDYSLSHLLTYADTVYWEMTERKYKVRWAKFITPILEQSMLYIPLSEVFNGWHNDRYLCQCLYNLQEKYDCGGIPEEEWQVIKNRWPEILKGE